LEFLWYFDSNIPVSGTSFSRNTVVLSSRRDLSQAVFFSADYKIDSQQTFYKILRLHQLAKGSSAAILIFRGPSAARVMLAQECFLYTTPVTVNTTVTSSERQPNRERIHGADI
jgi:hypothetical protein